jgi:hypothetical protein
LFKFSSVKQDLFDFLLEHLTGTRVALEFLSLVARHPLQRLLADDMTTCQQLRLVVLGAGLLAHGTHEDVVTLEVLGEFDLDR